jgi:phosphoribosylaminoimidazolecarboxamide formyltransferase / IMP cyclohydrolase
MPAKVRSALVSVYYKDGLEELIKVCQQLEITLYSTGGTQKFIEDLGVQVKRVEDLTGYPSILGGRVKTLHPNVFGGILAIRNDDHLSQLAQYGIPEIDLVIVDLYPFEETVASGANHEEVIEKIDIGGISLIRAAAKNYQDVAIISSKDQYSTVAQSLIDNDGVIPTLLKTKLAAEAFMCSSQYDTAIYEYMSVGSQNTSMTFKRNFVAGDVLRYGENPHQKGYFFGDQSELYTKLCGKELSYNNLVDIDAALLLIHDLESYGPTFAILKHTNACGVASRASVLDAWNAALAADPVSAFGGILICNHNIDLAAAREIDKIFYEVLLAPSFDQDALELLMAKSKRIILQTKEFSPQQVQYKSLLNGVIVQDADLVDYNSIQYVTKTQIEPSDLQLEDLKYANICAKHLKSNTIVFVKDKQLLGMGCGQTSRVDACRNGIEKAKEFGFSLKGAVMASDAFFPFPDCVELGIREGICAVIQPGGSIKDQLSIDFCDSHGIAMIFTGHRHFKH